jgi:hypothetical protein
MQVLVETRDPQAQALRELAEQRVRFSMRRLSWLVPKAKVHLRDLNGPRGGVDKQCQIELLTTSGQPVVVSSTARDWRSALERALARASRALMHIWRRRPSHPRQRPPVIDVG